MKPLTPCYNAWREFEAYAVPMTEEGERAMVRRMHQFRAGYCAAIKDVIRMMELQHEATEGRHNYWKIAANLVAAELGENSDEG